MAVSAGAVAEEIEQVADRVRSQAEPITQQAVTEALKALREE